MGDDLDDYPFASDFGTSSHRGSSRRTLVLSGLSASVTHGEIVSVIKGGKVLNITFKSPHRAAIVTFVDGASRFLHWATRNDLKIQSRRVSGTYAVVRQAFNTSQVEVKWAQHQHQIDQSLRKSIALGATRNLVIQGAEQRGLTEARIRSDMEHIDQLVIIDISFRNGNAYISTNSIGHARHARFCMMSRAEYKACKVNYDADECDVALPHADYVIKPGRLQSAPKHIASKKSFASTNKFAVLETEFEDNASNDDASGQGDDCAAMSASDDNDSYGIPYHTRRRVDLSFLDSDDEAAQF